MRPSRVPIYRALYRPHLVLGGEREPVLTLALLCAGVAVTSLNVPALVTALLIWLFGIWGLRAIAKIDPFMTRIYQRHLTYRGYYPPRSTPFHRNKTAAGGSL
jgi:type IV secretion system protein TrbD